MMFLAATGAAGAAHAQGSGGDENVRYNAALFAGGNFWAMEEPFEGVAGVVDVRNGFAGGGTVNPTYEQVESGITGHMEVVQVVYDPTIVNFPTLLDIFWRNIDPFDPLGQFCDKGDPWKAVIFTESPAERNIAEMSRDVMVKRFGKSVATDIRNAKDATFYPADPGHQDYYRKHPWKYKFYRSRCKRDSTLKKIWGDEAGGYGFGQRAE
jgi:peptide-methionine (S)-S-oxide reductase